MRITTNDEDSRQSRIVIEVNGFEVDVIADSEGICVDINRIRDSVHCTSASFEWDERHENEVQS